MSPWASMSRSTRLRRALAALGKAIGLNAEGLATMPASSAASGGVSTDEHEGRGTLAALSPQPVVVPSVPEAAS
jgi:hypothetical protein